MRICITATLFVALIDLKTTAMDSKKSLEWNLVDVIG